MFKKLGLIGLAFLFIFISFEVYIIYEQPIIRTYNTKPHSGGSALTEKMTMLKFQ